MYSLNSNATLRFCATRWRKLCIIKRCAHENRSRWIYPDIFWRNGHAERWLHKRRLSIKCDLDNSLITWLRLYSQTACVFRALVCYLSAYSAAVYECTFPRLRWDRGTHIARTNNLIIPFDCWKLLERPPVHHVPSCRGPLCVSLCNTGIDTRLVARGGTYY